MEGDSAGGSAKQGRDRKNQAILPLRGKILNVEKARLDKMIASEAIANLITAIGVGLGAESFNYEKLRYHKIVIMTDADVDGAHIRTLLLTFFFRHMRKLIESGHLYIAQPPLYRLKKGKRDVYIKDESAFEEFLISASTDTLQLLDDMKAPVKKERTEELIRLSMTKNKLLDRIDRYSDARLAVGFCEAGATNAMFEDNDTLKALVKDVSSKLAIDDGGVQIVSDDSHGGYKIRVPAGANDNMKTLDFDFDFFSTPEYRDLIKITQKERVFGSGPYEVIVGEEKVLLESVEELWTLAEKTVKKGLSVQRYKGLGEMNPEQLWETTMNPDTRTLLRVTLEDFTEADEIFSILMGDQVEPRREFIENNALLVKNLDI